MRKLLTLAVLLTLGLLIQAADAVPIFKARIDISSKDVALKPVSGPEGGSLANIFWGKEELRKFNLTGETAQLPDDQWIKATFTFIPESDGQVNIRLMSNSSRDKDKKNSNIHRVFYDMVTVEGGTLTNGDFEDANNGVPAGWNCKGMYITTEMKAFSGNAMVKVWQNKPCHQTIDVKKDQQVTVTVNVKQGDFEPAKE